MNRIPTAIALWQLKLLTSEEVVTWADQQILADDRSSEEMIDLSTRGPEECSMLQAHQFPPAREFTFEELCLLKLGTIKLENRKEKEVFIDWISRACIGKNLKDRFVSFGYQLDHLVDDCRDMDAAIRLFESELPGLISEASSFLEKTLNEYKVEPSGGHNSGSSAASIVTP
ncbi:hypothetical protein VDG1235_4874 [Verrucomicrobiia bacterium DG1235]|nr:hypothetical protein VDG1235_4874 [Verrucomicrobiae bacterium DG1235]